jgi:soluble P-type ATPase
MQIVIPEQEPFALAHLICDVNGTLAVDGSVPDAVLARLGEVARVLAVHLVTSDTFGTADQIGAALGGAVHVQHVTTGTDKAVYARMLGPESVAAIGNGRNDLLLFACARLRIAVCSGEGLAPELLAHTDILVTSPLVALDLLLHPQRLVATLRT